MTLMQATQIRTDIKIRVNPRLKIRFIRVQLKALKYNLYKP